MKITDLAKELNFTEDELLEVAFQLKITNTSELSEDDVENIKEQLLIDLPKETFKTNPKDYPYLYKYGHNMTDLYEKEQKLPVTIGRDKEMRQMMEVLAQKSKNNVLLVAPPGVGKTNLVEGLAQKIVLGEVPNNLKNRELWEINLAGLTSTDTSDGGFQVRLKEIIKEIEKSEGYIVSFIDEVHLIMMSGSQGLDAANIMKPALARGKLRLIGATTEWEYHKYLETDGAITRRFSKISIKEPNEKDTLEILQGLRRSLETFHNVTITDEAMEQAVEKSIRYVTNRNLPDKAIDILDKAAARVSMSIDSMPPFLDNLQSEILRLKANIESEVSTTRLIELRQELKQKEPILQKGIEEWKNNVNDINEIKLVRKDIQRILIQMFEERSKETIDNDKLKQLTIDLSTKEKELRNKRVEYHRVKPLIDDEVTSETVMEVIETLTGVPVTEMSQSDLDKMKNLKRNMSLKIIGQEEAVEATTNAVKASRLGFSNPDQPIGTFIFLGPSGTGKAIVNEAFVPVYNHSSGQLFIQHGELKEGDYVYNRLGNPVKVLNVFPQGLQETYEVELEDGRTVLCNHEHLWTTVSILADNVLEYSTQTTNDMIQHGLYNKLGNYHYYLPAAQPFESSNTELPDLNYLQLIEGLDEEFDLSLLNTSIKNRKYMVKQLEDKEGVIRVMSKQVAKAVRILLNGLGYSIESYRESLAYVFEYSQLEFIGIRSIKRLGYLMEQSCIQVDDPEQLYQVTRGHVVTHNTETVKVLAEEMFGSRRAMKRFDMGEFKSERSIERLIGAPPGYDSDDQGGELTEFVKNNPYSIILLDEGEKSHPAIWDLFLSVFDEGELSDSHGEMVNFKNTIIIITSNLGAREIRMGYERKEPMANTRAKIMAILQNNNTDEGGKGFKPEFLNRIDSVVIFRPLIKEDVIQIANIKLKQLKELLKKSRDINLVFQEKIPEIFREDRGAVLDIAYWMAEYGMTKEDYRLGARPINRLIDNHIKNKLVDLFIEEGVQDGSYVLVKTAYPNPVFYKDDLGRTVPHKPYIDVEVIDEVTYKKLIEVDPTNEN